MVQHGLSQTNPATTSLETQDRHQLEQFLRFRLIPDTTLLLPVSQLTEVITIPVGQIVPIPQMPSWVMGVYNWRGEILWMIDLGELLGLTPWQQQPQVTPIYRTIVLHSGAISQNKAHRQHLGAVVSGVDDIEWCNPNDIQSPPGSTMTSNLAPFLRGYWLPPHGDMLVVLDGEAILAAMPKP
ncbi:putative CheW-like protein [Crocosphaera subtropica ATCC 51142]|uniref:CheW-like protein n=1 Tax=Crocosphaera subtropica (strain ATCC 51142 / BH68) TaxID=43989 RepID=B1WRV1_CROS5|nr:chemotaxis protein CheW [Crocosphaera subtropica]ACB53542.1 putative CheW-like protein [Crocosphaera subtropica ATCC 51142]